MGLTRRQFIAGAGAAGTAAAAGFALTDHAVRRAFGWDVTTSHTPALSTPVTRQTGVLVLVVLYGGNDGLNTLVPYQDAAYLAGRPTLGLQHTEVIPLDSDLALHGSLTGLKALWDQKKLAIVRGVGYPNPNYSHFRSMDIWQSGVPDRDEPTGWLGRWLDGMANHDPLAAMSLGPTLPKLLQGAKVAGAALPEGTLAVPGDEATFAALEKTYAGESPLAAQIAQSGTDLLTVLHSVRDVLSQTPSTGSASLENGSGADNGAAGTTTTVPGARSRAAGTGLGAQLDTVSRLIKGGLPTRIYVVSLGGFDTHGNEKTTQARLLTEVDQAVSAFVNGMADHPEVVLATFSEFGRRVAENASNGTDHGSAAPLFVAGGGVRGGYFGDEPPLGNLDNGNLRFTTDFRAVFSTLAPVAGVDPKPVLGTFASLGFL